jgi:GTP-binding protein
LLRELGSYRPELVERPRLVVGSKADAAAPDVDFSGDRISAATGEGIPELLGRLRQLVDEARRSTPAPEAFIVHRPVPEGVRIERADDGAWVVVGRLVERAVALSDITNVEALAYAQERLRQLGVDRALARAGAREGDLVHIGGFTFEYEED